MATENLTAFDQSPCSVEQVQLQGAHPERCFVRLTTDALAPRYLAGDIAEVDVHSAPLTHGRLALFRERSLGSLSLRRFDMEALRGGLEALGPVTAVHAASI
jgi:hypothetical protein